jgi:hypothetical protein
LGTTWEDIALLLEKGMRIYSLVPDGTLIAKVPMRLLGTLQQEPSIVWAGPYEPE